MSDNHDHGHSHDDGAVHPHIASVKLYVGIFLALIFFTVITVALSLIHLGPANLAIAILIATVKAALVVTFFMHLKDDNRFNALVFIGSLLFGGVFLAYTLNDTDRRSEVDSVQGAYIYEATGELAPGGRPAVERPVQPASGASHGAAPGGH
jgi:cytochrome c oxidase subunit 4